MHQHHLDRLFVNARHAKGAHTACGFGLIEMMIALVLGLIVSGSVIAFIGSVVRANAQTIRVTRLNQELRSVSEVIGHELRRARALSDPLVDIGNPSGATHVSSIGISVNGSCITYGYGGSGQGDFRALWLDAGGNIELARGSTAQACTDGTGTVLNSPLVIITGLAIGGATAPPFPVNPCSPAATSCGNRFDITLSGRMRGDTMVRLGDETTNPITRTYYTSLQIRSTGVP